MQKQVTKRQVQIIQSIIRTGFMNAALIPVIKQRAAAYAHVSTEHDERHGNYEAQVDYYTKKLTERSDWAFVRFIRIRAFRASHEKKT